jgi:hypothetical protein
MPKKTICFMVSLFFLTLGVAQAQVSIIYSSSGKQYVSMEIADDWLVNVGSEADSSQSSGKRKEPARLVSAMPKSTGPLWFAVWVPEFLEKIEDAEEYMKSLGLNLLDDVVIAERKFETMSSMDTYYVSGTGTKKGKDMDFRAVFFQLAEDTVFIAIYIGPHEMTLKYGADLAMMVESLKPVNQQ